MGIKNLHKVLKHHCPDVYHEVHLSHYAYKKVAIDTSLYMFKYKTIFGEDKWLNAFINLVCCLRRNEIHCVFIYDTSAPVEKSQERVKRKENRDKNEQRILLLDEAFKKAKQTGVYDQVLLDLRLEDVRVKSLLRPNAVQSVNLDRIEEYIAKLKNQIVSITQADFDLTKKLFTILGIPFYQAVEEAETSCSDLCKRGLVDAVISEDTDVLAYGAPIFLTKLNTATNTCMEISYERILGDLDMTSDQFTDFCIMCGTDYNDNIFKIGPENALKLIKQYESIDKMEHLDTSCLKHNRVRELFKEYKSMPLVSVPYCGIPDFEALSEFMFKFRIHYPIETIKKHCGHAEIQLDSPTRGEIISDDSNREDSTEAWHDE